LILTEGDRQLRQYDEYNSSKIFGVIKCRPEREKQFFYESFGKPTGSLRAKLNPRIWNSRVEVLAALKTESSKAKKCVRSDPDAFFLN